MWHVLRDFKIYCRKAGIKTDKKLTLHCLRKSYATNLANAGIPVNTLKDLLGHSSVAVTMSYYVSSLDENKKKAVGILDRMMKTTDPVAKDQGK
jgi:integrase